MKNPRLCRGIFITLFEPCNHSCLPEQKKVVENGVTTTYDYTLHGKLITHLTKRVVDMDGVETSEELHFFYDAQSRPAMVEYNSAMYSYLHNLQGDIVGIVDAEGTLVVEYKYDAWGKPVSTTGSLAGTLADLNPFRYRGYCNCSLLKEEDMKVDIREMAARLFSGTPVVLDLDTGDTYIPVLQHHRKIVENLENTRILPSFSWAPIYQAYVTRINKELGIVPWEGFDDYPRFELIPDLRTDEQKKFTREADHFCSGFDYALCNERIKPEPKYDPSFPVFKEFKNSYTLQFAKGWCHQEGYEWYNE